MHHLFGELETRCHLATLGRLALESFRVCMASMDRWTADASPSVLCFLALPSSDEPRLSPSHHRQGAVPRVNQILALRLFPSGDGLRLETWGAAFQSPVLVRASMDIHHVVFPDPEEGGVPV